MSFPAFTPRTSLLASALAALLGLFFVLSAIGKLLDVEAFSWLLHDYGLGEVSWIAPLIPPAELLLGVLLCLGVRARLCAILAFSMLVVFSVGFVYAYFWRGVSDCGCFGTLTALKTSPTLSFLRNAVLLLLCVAVWRLSPDEVVPLERWQRASLVLLMGVVCILSGMSYREPLYTTSPFLMERIESTPLGALLDNRSADTLFSNVLPHHSSSSSYLVFAFGLSCPHCWNMSENVKSFVHSSGSGALVSGVLGIGGGDSLALRRYIEHVKPNFPIRIVSDSLLSSIVQRYPTAFLVEHGVITRVWQQEIPSAATLRAASAAGSTQQPQ